MQPEPRPPRGQPPNTLTWTQLALRDGDELCSCGCGQKVKLARSINPALGWIKGRLRRAADYVEALL